MSGQEDENGVTISLRDIYVTVTKTHEAVLLMNPQVARIESTANTALAVATEADKRSKDNERRFKVIRNFVGVVASGTTLGLVGTWISKHVH